MITIDDLREARKQLQATIDYCPSEISPTRSFERAEVAAAAAQHRYDELAPTFALLDAIDALGKRVEMLDDLHGLLPDDREEEPCTD